ncbi:RNA polymerase sigma factor [Cupriavidus basilensis]|uniref:RNA polymerase sigma factor n=1 Tax=Cupriavidus basilensis TaxID=68895 RepID=A0ABT6AL15_9BURK|nr:RNA polymerase sigma factor [Cupriavidus basilensis]MDF3833300.1 RNA polymerase sigma factor [Cupriavidus basilensis]
MMDGASRVVLREVLVENYDRLRRRLIRHLGCPDLAGECLHDAWLRLGDMRAVATLLSPEAYVYRVACNLATDRFRQRRPWSFVSDAATELEQLTDPSPGLDVMIELRANLEALDGVLESLPHRHRGVLMNLRVEGLSRQEVAERHRISLRSVDTVLRQALDYCGAHMGHPLRGGVSSPRRALPKMRRSSNARAALSAGSAAHHADARAMPGHLHEFSTHD